VAIFGSPVETLKLVNLKNVERIELPLTLIRMAGGVYDSQNFEQVQLHNALSNEKL
jgi:hypothetical protein